jgi:hypothetical protein
MHSPVKARLALQETESVENLSPTNVTKQKQSQQKRPVFAPAGQDIRQQAMRG